MVYCDKIEVAEPLDNIGRLEISTMSEDLFLEVNLETALLAGKLTLERKRNESLVALCTPNTCQPVDWGKKNSL